MEKTKDYVSDILKIVSIICFGYVGIMALVYMKREICGVPTTAIFIISSVIVMVSAYGSVVLNRKKSIQRILERKECSGEKKENIHIFIAAAVLLGFQLIVVWNVVFRTSWDPGAVWYGAHYVSMGDKAGIESMAYYFSVYPNNLILVFIYSVILKLNMLIGTPIANGTMLLAFFQCFLISLSSILFFKTAKRIVGYKLAWVGYFFYFVLVGLSGWILIPYSDSTGLIFPILMLYIYIRIKESGDVKKQCLGVFALCFLGYVGFKIKPMVLIVLIAIVGIEGVNFIRQFKWKENTGIKESLKCMVSGALGVIIAMVLVNVAIKSMEFPIVTDTVLGWQHHMMLGLNKNTNGGYSQDDFDYSTSFATSDEQHEAEFAVIKQRLKDFGISGYLEHFVKKSSRNYFDANFGWGGGASFYTEIFPERNNKLCPLLRSLHYDNNDENLYKYNSFIRQNLWYIIIFSMIFSTYNRENMDDKMKVLILSILGLMMYLQIFEAHARYVFTFVPLYIIAAGLGIKNIKARLLIMWYSVKNNFPKNKDIG